MNNLVRKKIWLSLLKKTNLCFSAHFWIQLSNLWVFSLIIIMNNKQEKTEPFENQFVCV